MKVAPLAAVPTPVGQCPVCDSALPTRSATTHDRGGRPPRYCSNACRQRAYRQRSATGSTGQERPDAVGSTAALDMAVGRRRGSDTLTNQEYHVVTLVTEGLTNQQIRIDHLRTAPGRVRKGGYVTLLGSLQRLTSTGMQPAYVAYPGKQVKIYFRPKGATTFRYVTAVTTGQGGRFARRVKVTSTGWWQIRFAGTSDFASLISGNEYVVAR